MSVLMMRASDYSTARSTRTHSFSDDSRSTPAVDTVREDAAFSRNTENVSLNTIKSDSLHATKESDSDASSSGNGPSAGSLTPTNVTTGETSHLQQEDKGNADSDSVAKTSEDGENNNSTVESETKPPGAPNLNDSPTEIPEPSISADSQDRLTEDSNNNSTTTNSNPLIPKEESESRPLENNSSARSDYNPAADDAGRSSVEQENTLHTLTVEDPVVRRRPADSEKAASRPLSDASDIQIESTFFVQGRRLEDDDNLDDETTNEQEPNTQEKTNQNSEITNEGQIQTENQSSEATTEQEAQAASEQEPEAGTEQEPEATTEQVQSFEETTVTTTEVLTIQTVETTTEQQPSNNDDSDMGDNAKLEEKLKQFRSQAKETSTEKCPVNPLQLSELDKQRRRNLIFDEERFEETFLKCLICREIYNETDKLPKMLHCHHTFCMDCLYQMYRVEGEFRQSLTSVFRGMPMTVKIQCPTCREGIIISEAELRRLPNDHTIMELLSFVTVTGKSDISYCPKHQMQPLNFFCEPCIMPVCCDCTVIDHKESRGHKVVNVDEAMKKYTPILEETLNDIRSEKASLANKREAIESAQDDLDRVQTGITDQIRLVFDTIREVLEERERELHDVAEAEVDRKRAVLNEHLKNLTDRESDLNSEFNSLQQAKDDKDLSQIFTGHKSARELLVKKVHIPTNSTQGFSITFQYSSRSDSVIKQQVANLGDIIFHSA